MAEDSNGMQNNIENTSASSGSYESGSYESPPLNAQVRSRLRPLPGSPAERNFSFGKSAGEKSANKSADKSATEQETGPSPDKKARPPRRTRRERKRGDSLSKPGANRSSQRGQKNSGQKNGAQKRKTGRRLRIAGDSAKSVAQPRTIGDKASSNARSSSRLSAVSAQPPSKIGAKAASSRSASSRSVETASTTAKSTGKPTQLSKTNTPKSRVAKAAGKNSANNSLARRRSARKQLQLSKPVLWAIRLLVGGLGIAAIGGTILAVRPNASSPSASQTDSALATTEAEASVAFPITLNQELVPLKAELEELPNTYPGLTPKAFYVDVDTGEYVSVGGQESIAAASTIKLPILLAFFEEVDSGRIDLNQTMAMSPEQVAEGSGEMQMSPPGTQFTALEVATQMIIDSDNTATNMMIDLMGGAAALNDRFAAYGLEKTQLNNPLPDLTGTNTTSARDLAHTMLLISQGDSLTMRSRDRIFNILNRTYSKGLIPAGLEEKGALTYNKTGDIESVLGDVSLVDVSNGKRYVLAALVERPSNDRRAVELIHRISKRIYRDAEKAIQPAVSPLGDPNGPTRTPTPATPTPTEAAPDNGEGQSSEGQGNNAQSSGEPVTSESGDPVESP